MESFAWPATVLIFGIFFILIFKKPLTNLINRTRSISRNGIETNSDPQKTQVEAQKKLPENVPTTADEFLKEIDNKLLVETEGHILQGLDEKGIKDSAERERVLTKLLAINYIAWNFERAFSSIWGSQIEALQFLTCRQNTPVEEQALRSFYDNAAVNYPEVYENYSFDRWIGFLLAFQLVIQTENTFTISLGGHEFLKYLVTHGYTFFKLF